ncbi:alpha/beta hydrolase fold domain-containing protein [Planotetraspora phitsanulokensis]|uniref:alpha/beta hydrolase fold domain-containing protein n=1 Tax=Planotetraspora phitsanulokensis TaxID=575192 RepID=UPI0023B2471F|nr:alpha/beta hydrolase fold domain-containing protein [Planotetraspora phitsanulokensis]
MYAAAGELGVDPGRIAVVGESAGGGLAASLAQLVRDRAEIPLRAQLLIYPMLDDRTAAETDPNPCTGEFVWTRESNHFGWASLLGHENGGERIAAYASPARADDVGGLAPAFIAVGSLDLFLDEGVRYAYRLMRAGVPVELHVQPGAVHGYMSLDVEAGRRLRRDAVDALRAAFAG